MKTDIKKSTCRWLRSACLASAVLVGLTVFAAEPPAFIKNRAVMVGGGKEIDAAVRVIAIDSHEIDAGISQFEVAPGKHAIEVECTARVFVGMGTVDFPERSALSVELKSGRTYQLDATVTVKGECVPVLNPH
ncbi:MAG: hypothetical protein ABL878_10355 [Burkholderiales bacterium]